MSESESDLTSLWDQEYRRRGIPSSRRAEPSGSLLWFLANWPVLAAQPLRHALDVGCGAGRNSLALARRGAQVVGVDSSRQALAQAQEVAQQFDLAPGHGSVRFVLHDLGTGLPVEDHSQDAVVDMFASFHLTTAQARQRFFADVERSLSPGGLYCVSLATDLDGYYRTCPQVGQIPMGQQQVPIVRDEAAGIDNILPTEHQFLTDVALHSSLELAMFWRKPARNTMHGTEYPRLTLTTVWQVGENGVPREVKS